jgi:hypothetical protein
MHRIRAYLAVKAAMVTTIMEVGAAALVTDVTHQIHDN